MREPVPVGDLVRRQLRQVKRSAKELAEAVDLPPEYVDDLITGRRRPPLPARTDIYAKMTAFLQLSRNDLVMCALAERTAGRKPAGPGSEEVVDLMLELCEPATAKQLRRRQSRKGDEELADLLQRVLDVAQGTVRRMLDDQIGLRVAASRNAATYPAMRMRVLDFLDATPDTLTPRDLAEFVRPRILSWDVDLETGVLKVVLRPQEPRMRERRQPMIRGNTRRRG